MKRHPLYVEIPGSLATDYEPGHIRPIDFLAPVVTEPEVLEEQKEPEAVWLPSDYYVG